MLIVCCSHVVGRNMIPVLLTQRRCDEVQSSFPSCWDNHVQPFHESTKKKTISLRLIFSQSSKSRIEVCQRLWLNQMFSYIVNPTDQIRISHVVFIGRKCSKKKKTAMNIFWARLRYQGGNKQIQNRQRSLYVSLFVLVSLAFLGGIKAQNYKTDWQKKENSVTVYSPSCWWKSGRSL